MVNRQIGAVRVIFLGIIVFGYSTSLLQAEQPPNIVFMLADDLGWSDTTPYGGTFYETPNIQKLADQGVRYTNAYSASPLCSPTRASILSGQYPGRIRLTTPACHLKQVVLEPVVPEFARPSEPVTTPGTRTRFPNSYITIAEVLKEAGYSTSFFGKWHLGRAPYFPEQQGFDLVVGGREHPGPPRSYFAPWPIDTIPESPPGSHIDDVITAEAVKFLKANQDKPFYLNMWFYSVHAPFEAKQPLIEKYRRKAIHDPENPQKNPVMGGMVETLDDNVGLIVQTLKDLNLLENTLIIFTSDNGGNMYNFVEGLEATNNAPLSAGKAHILEGGHRVPLIVCWDGKTEPGTVNHSLVSSVDYFPTIIKATDSKQPTDQVCDGVNILPTFFGKELPKDRAIFTHFPHGPPATGSLPASSVRQGDWKLIRIYGDAPNQEDRFELYDLAEDIGEKKNIADQNPVKTNELRRLLEDHLKNTESLIPAKNPRYQPSELGWTGNKDAKLNRESGILKIISQGNDPWIHTSAFPQGAKGEVSLWIRMKSNATGPGAVYYATKKQPLFHRVRMQNLPVKHDNQWHDYRVDITVNDQQITQVRIDPANKPGEIEIDRIRLISWSKPGAGRVLRDWQF